MDAGPNQRSKLTFELRFWGRVDVCGPEDCWNWLGMITQNGYGSVWTGEKNRAVHRVAWELTKGPIPKGEGYHGTCVCHTCDNRRCCNPRHLWLGTNAENMNDMKAKGRGGNPKGDAHGSTKITDAMLPRIIALRNGGALYREIAPLFGVSDVAVRYAMTVRVPLLHKGDDGSD